ncbi:molybdopterin synthase catalytic subunit MoaE [Pseudaeromonas sharmana]|uniref:Molybdopterin synthase catalytic subunit n=1 Tax=Pseudaeromonas sharmana TaxID=328412 RepID=A0ABV8CPC8_9GAMM
MERILVTDADFSLAEEYAALSALPAAGAIVSFVGRMRDINQGDAVCGLTLEHYPGMTERVLAELVASARQRWDLQAVTLIHRVGAFAPCDQIVLVLVASGHRGEAFAACEYLMDVLKTRAPFWKQETLRDGSQRWVASRSSDQAAAARW